jgi:crotonobetainyl-CoA:carnitine CoA-transferase CaiB-like acyl-CoA transferase
VEVEVNAAYPLKVDTDQSFVHQHPRIGSVKLVGPAVSYNGKKMPVTRPPPWLGQHTDEVRRIFIVSGPPSSLN